LDALLEFRFEGPVYPVNPKGGEIAGLKVYRQLEEIPHAVDYVISTIPAQGAPRLVEECAGMGVKAIHFCTAGFSETGEAEGTRLEAELIELSRREGIRIIGPNCMGFYCPESRLSFNAGFPKESGPVAFVSQSGGHSAGLVKQAMWRGVRFSKVISYGNACDLNESDFLEYLAADAGTEIIALYIEGVKDGRRFRRALEEATREKVVVLLKGGLTEGGVRAAAGHTGVLAGSEATWDALCKQLGIIRVSSLEEAADVLVTLLFMPLPQGRSVALVGGGGGSSVLVTDEFEKRGLKVPALTQEIRSQIRAYSAAAGNILGNPIDYSQTVMEAKKLAKTISIVSGWEGIDFIIEFLIPSEPPPSVRRQIYRVVDEMLVASRASSKPVAMVLEPSFVPEEAEEIFPFIQKVVASGLPVYYSFASAANAISLVLNHHERR
jgi:acyl-CoA synthetase (NDP forming)